MISLDDFEKYARDNLPKKVFNHVSNGAADQQTLHDNRSAFKRYGVIVKVNLKHLIKVYSARNIMADDYEFEREPSR